MQWVGLLPFLLQALCIAVDEIYFHLRRGLPRWERIGHPLDTLTVLACLVFAIWVPYSTGSLLLYCLLAIFSSLFVTKDEFVHKKHCPAAEQWLHALLFTLHPLALLAVGLLWPAAQAIEIAPALSPWLPKGAEAALFLRLQGAAMTLFFLYQIVFWNFLWKEKIDPSTTNSTTT